MLSSGRNPERSSRSANGQPATGAGTPAGGGGVPCGLKRVSRMPSGPVTRSSTTTSSGFPSIISMTMPSTMKPRSLYSRSAPGIDASGSDAIARPYASGPHRSRQYG